MLLYYLPVMRRLNDITLYDLFNPSEGQRQFQHRANYVSGLYRECLNGYQPPRTTRISISLVSKQHPPYASMAGSVATIYQYAHAPTYNALSDPAKLRYLLDCLHDAAGNLCRAFLWDMEVFQQANQQVQKILHLELQQNNVIEK